MFQMDFKTEIKTGKGSTWDPKFHQRGLGSQNDSKQYKLTGYKMNFF